jgi:hypothetical protein
VADRGVAATGAASAIPAGRPARRRRRGPDAAEPASGRVWAV